MSESGTGIHVTVYDGDTGDRESQELSSGPDGYVLTCGPGCYLAHTQMHANGTTVLTVKPTEPHDTEGTA